MTGKHRSIAATLAVLIAFGLTACATTRAIDNQGVDDQFSAELDTLYARRITTEHWLLASAIGLLAGVATATAATTAGSLNQITSGLATAGEITGYILSTAGSIGGVAAFAAYQKSVNDYLEALRLQAQYYNMIDVGKNGDAP